MPGFTELFLNLCHDFLGRYQLGGTGVDFRDAPGDLGLPSCLHLDAGRRANPEPVGKIGAFLGREFHGFGLELIDGKRHIDLHLVGGINLVLNGTPGCPE